MFNSGQSPFVPGFYLINGDGASGNTSQRVLRLDSLIKVSAASTSPFLNGGTAPIATDTLGLRSTYAITWKIPIWGKFSFSGQLAARIYWAVVSGSAGTPKGKLELDVQNNGVPIGGLTLATSGSERALSGTPSYSELLLVDIPQITLLPGTTLNIILTPRITTVSGSGGSVASLSVKTDPATAGSDSKIEFP